MSKQILNRLIPSLLMVSGLAAADLVNDRAQLQARVPGVKVDLNVQEDAASWVISPDGRITGPGGVGKALAADPGNVDNRDGLGVVRRFLATYPELFGGGPELIQDAEKVMDGTNGLSKTRTVIWRQRIDGVPVDGGLIKANIAGDGALIAIGSHFVPHPAAAAGKVAKRSALLKNPTISAAAAIANALRKLDPGAPADEPKALAAPFGASKEQVITAKGLMHPAEAELMWIREASGNLRLTWHCAVPVEAWLETHDVHVDAETGAMLKSHRRTRWFVEPSADRKPLRSGRPAPSLTEQQQKRIAKRSLATPAVTTKSVAPRAAGGGFSMTVYDRESPNPMLPGLAAPSTAQADEVPRVTITDSALDPTPAANGYDPSPAGWIDSNLTQGNNVDAFTYFEGTYPANPIGSNASRAAGTGTSPVVFDFPIDLSQAPNAGTNPKAATVNMFYWLNRAHDRMYRYGFDEAHGNFQMDNFSRGGISGDPIKACVLFGYDTGSRNNAFFASESGLNVTDGTQCYIAMFAWDAPQPDRDGSFDATIMIHEYTHGVTMRLVGNGLGGLWSLQGGGLGEGWADFVALALLAPTDPALTSKSYPVGSYATYGWISDNYFRGIRRFPYSTDRKLNAQILSNIDGNLPEVHDMGEIWTSCLWDLRCALVNKYGGDGTAGNDRAMTLLVNGLALTPTEPTYIQARDALIQASMSTNFGNGYGADVGEIWLAFTGRGFGLNASVPTNPWESSPVKADTTPYIVKVGLGATTYSVKKSAGSIDIPVSFSKATQWQTSVNYTTVAVSASEVLDYTPTSGTLTFGTGTTTGLYKINVPIIRNSLVQGPVHFQVVLSAPSAGLVLDANATTDVTITDVNGPSVGVIAIDPPTYRVNEGSTVRAGVVRAVGATGPTSVTWTAVPGTAGALDFLASSGTIIFNSGEAGPKFIDIPILADLIFEDDEQFTIELSNPTLGAVLGVQAVGTITIANVAPAPGDGASTTSTSFGCGNGTTIAVIGMLTIFLIRRRRTN